MHHGQDDPVEESREREEFQDREEPQEPQVSRDAEDLPAAGRMEDPVAVLGCTDLTEAEEWLEGRPVTPGEVEGVALRRYEWRRHLHEEDSYWVTVTDAARILRTSPSTVRRLLATGALPYRRHRSGTRLIKRARLVGRRLAHEPGERRRRVRRESADRGR